MAKKKPAAKLPAPAKNPVEALIDFCNTDIFSILSQVIAHDTGPRSAAIAQHAKTKFSKLLAQARTYVPPEREVLQAIVNDIETLDPDGDVRDLVRNFVEAAEDVGVTVDPKLVK